MSQPRYNPSSPPYERSIEAFSRYSLEEYRKLGEIINGWGRRANYTPVWSSSGTQPSLGNGTLTGRAAIVAGMVFLAIRLGIGTTTTFGTGTWFFSTPFPVANEDMGTWQGTAFAQDISVPQWYTGVCHFNTNANRNLLNVYLHGGATPVGVGVPFAWANLDQLVLNCHYPAE